MRLRPEHSVLVVIDLQDKLLAAMPHAADLVRNAGFLIDVAHLLDIPVLATEQYPQGLGPTTATIAARLRGETPAKKEFSCCAGASFRESLVKLGRREFVLVGMETNVCVLQTALDLLEEGYRVFIPADGVKARFPLDHEAAMRRMEKAGAVPGTVETFAFEWLVTADHPRFKEVSRLIRERTERVPPTPSPKRGEEPSAKPAQWSGME